ncbi:MAG TPA: hypothetical protein VF188_12850 [Longimicrobiales bacterium]
MGPAPHQPRGRWREFAVRLAFELLVVFIGVYAASALAEYEQERARAERRHQVRLALIREIEGLTANTRTAAENLGRLLADYDSLTVAGIRPPLDQLVWLEPVRIQPHVWEATLQGGALELLDVSTIYRLSEFYNEFNLGLAQIEQLRESTQRLLLPNSGRGPDAFYDASGELRPAYAWHVSGLRRLQALAASITERGTDLVAELRAAEGMDSAAER